MKRSFYISLMDSMQGLIHACTTERNMKIHLVLFVAAIVIFTVLGANKMEMALILLASGLVLVAELFNTAIENLIDVKVEKQYHPLAWIAKDVAAGGVLFASLISVVIGVLVFISILERTKVL